MEPTTMPKPNERTFSICFTSPLVLQKAMKIISSLLTKVDFQVQHDVRTGAYFLHMESSSPDDTCACELKLSCTGETAMDEPHFALNVEQLVRILKTPNIHGSAINMYQTQSDAGKVYISSSDGQMCQFYLDVLDLPRDDATLFAHLIPRWSIVLKTSMLKNYLSTQTCLKVNNVQLRVNRRKRGDADDEERSDLRNVRTQTSTAWETKGDEAAVIFTLESVGAQSGSRWSLPTKLHPHTSPAGASPAAKPGHAFVEASGHAGLLEVAGDKLTENDFGPELFTDVFPLQIMRNFITPINVSSEVILQVCALPPPLESHHVIVFEYQLDKNHSHIRYMITPTKDDDDASDDTDEGDDLHEQRKGGAESDERTTAKAGRDGGTQSSTEREAKAKRQKLE